MNMLRSIKPNNNMYEIFYEYILQHNNLTSTYIFDIDDTYYCSNIKSYAIELLDNEIKNIKTIKNFAFIFLNIAKLNQNHNTNKKFINDVSKYIKNIDDSLNFIKHKILCSKKFKYGDLKLIKIIKDINENRYELTFNDIYYLAHEKYYTTEDFLMNEKYDDYSERYEVNYNYIELFEILLEYDYIIWNTFTGYYNKNCEFDECEKLAEIIISYYQNYVYKIPEHIFTENLCLKSLKGDDTINVLFQIPSNKITKSICLEALKLCDHVSVNDIETLFDIIPTNIIDTDIIYAILYNTQQASQLHVSKFIPSYYYNELLLNLIVNNYEKFCNYFFHASNSYNDLVKFFKLFPFSATSLYIQQIAEFLSKYEKSYDVYTKLNFNNIFDNNDDTFDDPLNISTYNVDNKELNKLNKFLDRQKI